jgi:hypothetical protein
MAFQSCFLSISRDCAMNHTQCPKSAGRAERTGSWGTGKSTQSRRMRTDEFPCFRLIRLSPLACLFPWRAFPRLLFARTEPIQCVAAHRTPKPCGFRDHPASAPAGGNKKARSSAPGRFVAAEGVTAWRVLTRAHRLWRPRSRRSRPDLRQSWLPECNPSDPPDTQAGLRL